MLLYSWWERAGVKKRRRGLETHWRERESRAREQSNIYIYDSNASQHSLFKKTFTREASARKGDVLVQNSKKRLEDCCNTRKKGGLEATAPGKFFIQFFLPWLKIHLPISYMQLAIKTLENSAASVLYKRLPSRWLKSHPLISYLPLTITIWTTVDLVKSDFFGLNVKHVVKRDNFGGQNSMY